MKIADIEVAYLGHFGDDSTVVNAARVSFNKEVELPIGEGDAKLIRYLAVHKHHSPFNHAFLSFRIKAPIFVARQLVKHKFMPWNEVSRRYVDEEPEFYSPDTWRKRAADKKQGSMEEDCESQTFDIYTRYDWFDQKDIEEMTRRLYHEMLDKGVCPEQARMVLPQNTMTEWIWSGTLGAFLDMLKLRLDPHTQKETREVARQIASTVDILFPISFKEYINA